MGSWYSGSGVSHAQNHTDAQHTDVDSTGLADGQLLVWSVALGQWIPANPSGDGELAYAENVTGVITTIAGTSTANGVAVDIPNLSISVPVSARPVWVEGRFTVRQSVLGNGEAVIQLIETTAGAPVPNPEWNYETLPNNVTIRGRQKTLSVRHRLGATVAVRTFKIMARCDSVDATVPTFVVNNAAAAKSFLHAWAE